MPGSNRRPAGITYHPHHHPLSYCIFTHTEVHIRGHSPEAAYIRCLLLARYYPDSIMTWLTISVRALSACPFAHRARWRRQPQRTDQETHPPSPR
eukprot:6207420-Pleurochrysis_carterae.AAC.1